MMNNENFSGHGLRLADRDDPWYICGATAAICPRGENGHSGCRELDSQF